MKSLHMNHHRQAGSSLIEVLVAVLILSFGLLAMGAMLSFSVQMPKLSGYRSTATNLAADLIERIRANPDAFTSGAYSSALSYDGTFVNIASNDCAYPNCTSASLAAMDIAAIQRAARAALPAGGMLMKCDAGACGVNSYGNLWIVWQEPDSSVALNPTAADQCPVEVTGTYTSPKPRCLYVRFKV
jgi:type IV pilus assembly protein PilV